MTSLPQSSEAKPEMFPDHPGTPWREPAVDNLLHRLFGETVDTQTGGRHTPC
jgi:hypothetical protein